MSIATDIASLQIMAHVYKKASLQSILEKTCECLVNEVPYIDWVGIYLYEENEKKLVAASNLENDLKWEMNGELTFPIKNSNGMEIGLLVVRSREVIAFDVTDISTLKDIAQAIGEESLVN